ncbi:hypothetical protein [Coralloluteibacterium stylophorae]|uniref:Uncharacterized protein n=1 Tax=Coralloluteibacterium stylophorae TaxID=1776034 RepID=A0A8J8AXD1_9GAMM|nr:hypothetical protein [Coralloluteibacterium stylophorae]MBS7456312.1 hypothetical protein [Coralloluteibacterium stylophorae]
MVTQLKNTAVALLSALLMLGAGALLAEPVAAGEEMALETTSIEELDAALDLPADVLSGAGPSRHPRVDLAMPFFSFARMLPVASES